MLPKLNDHLRRLIDALPPEFSVFRTDWGNYVYIVRGVNIGIIDTSHFGEVHVSGKIVPSREYGSGAVVMHKEDPSEDEFIAACMKATSDIIVGLYVPPLPNLKCQNFLSDVELFHIRGEVVSSRRMRCLPTDELNGATNVYLAWDGLRLFIMDGNTLIKQLDSGLLNEFPPSRLCIDWALTSYLNDLEAKTRME